MDGEGGISFQTAEHAEGAEVGARDWSAEGGFMYKIDMGRRGHFLVIGKAYTQI